VAVASNGHMQVCTSLQTDNHASTPPLGFYRPDVQVLKACMYVITEHVTEKVVMTRDVLNRDFHYPGGP